MLASVCEYVCTVAHARLEGFNVDVLWRKRTKKSHPEQSYTFEHGAESIVRFVNRLQIGTVFFNTVHPFLDWYLINILTYPGQSFGLQ